MNPTNLESLIEQWKEDGKINKIHPENDLLTIPNLHSKYAAEVVLHQSALRKVERRLIQLRNVKSRYYEGKLNGTNELKEYGWQPWQLQLTKTQIATYVEADNDVMKTQALVDDHENAVEFCKMVVKQVSDRTWQIKSYLDNEKFKVGV